MPMTLNGASGNQQKPVADRRAMDSKEWYEQRRRAERVVAALGSVNADDLKTLLDAELERVMLLLAQVTGLAGFEHEACENKGGG